MKEFIRNSNTVLVYSVYVFHCG